LKSFTGLWRWIRQRYVTLSVTSTSDRPIQVARLWCLGDQPGHGVRPQEGRVACGFDIAGWHGDAVRAGADRDVTLFASPSGAGSTAFADVMGKL